MAGFPRLLTLGLVVALASLGGLHAQIPGHASLVPLGNMNSSILPEPTAVGGGATTTSNVAYFAGHDSEHGTEVWKWNGSGQATLHADVRPGPESGNPTQFTAMGNIVIWVANDGVRGPEIRGSQQFSPFSALTDLQPGAVHAPPQILGSSGGVVWFSTAAWHSGNPTTVLWAMVTFGDPVQVGVYARDSIQQVSAVPGQPHFYFIARPFGTDPRHSLYRVDGKKSAQLIENLDPAATGVVPPAGSYAATPGFVCYRQVSGGYLLRMLNFAEGFSTLVPSSDAATLPWFASNGTNRVCFAGRAGGGNVGLWTTLGTNESTTLLADVFEGGAAGDPSRLMMSPGNTGVFFQVNTGGAGRDLYFLDPAGPPEARKLRAGVQTSTKFAIIDAVEIVLDVPDNHIASLWLVDGKTGAGQWLGPVFTSLEKIWNPSLQVPPTRQLNVVGTTHSDGEELYRLNGPATLSLLNIYPGSSSAKPRQFFPWNSEQLMVADTHAEKGKLYRVGTAGQPALVPQIAALDVRGSQASSHPAEFTDCGTVLLFTAHDGASRRLCVSTDGQAGSASVLHGVHNPEQLVRFQGSVFMLGHATSGDTGVKKLYQAEISGTNVTVHAYDLAKHPATALIAAAGRLFFVEPGSNGMELLQSLLPDYSLDEPLTFYQDAAGVGITQLTASSGRLYFSGLAQPTGGKRVIWTTTGTAAGTRTPSSVLERPQLLGALGNACVFWREAPGGQEYQLITWDGGSPTSLAFQGDGPITNAPEPHRLAGKPAGVEAGGHFYFVNQGGAVLSTNGTGMQHLFSDPSLVVRPEALAALNDKLVFMAVERDNRAVLFTLSATLGVDFVRSLPGETLPCSLVNAGGRLYFTLAHLEANLGETELWHTDGTTPGTVPVLREVQRRENAHLPMGSFRGHLVLGANDVTTQDGIEPMLVNFDPLVPYPPVFTGARRGQPFSFTYEDMMVDPVTDPEGDTLSPLQLRIWDGTLTRNGSAVSDSTEIAPGDTFVWQPEPTQSGLVYPFELYVSDPWKEGRATVGIHIEAPVDLWTRDHFTGEEFFNEEISGRMADPDGDGVANALEFVFGRNPRTHTAEPACIASAADAPLGGGKVLRFTFTRAATLGEGTVLAVEVSPDLMPDSWQPVASRNVTEPWSGSATVTETAQPDGRVQVVVEIPAPAEGRAFMRLNVGL